MPKRSPSMLDNRTGQTPTTRPGRPDNLDADPDDQRVTLTWDLPTNTGGTEALTYQWRQGSTGTWESTGTQTTKTVTGLDNGTTYTFYVQAVNSAGAGPSASVTGRPAGRPGAPQNLMVEPGNQQVRIRWSPPANNGGSPIRKYEWKQGSGGWTSTGTAATVLVTSLNNNTGYTFYVRAVNDSGEGPEVSIDATPSQTEFGAERPDQPAGATRESPGHPHLESTREQRRSLHHALRVESGGHRQLDFYRPDQARHHLESRQRHRIHLSCARRQLRRPRSVRNRGCHAMRVLRWRWRGWRWRVQDRT